jgi:hypothetical protein
MESATTGGVPGHVEKKKWRILPRGHEAAKVTVQAASPIEDIDIEIEVTAVARA